MVNKQKNVKISEKHHTMLKSYCEKNGLKIHKIIEKWIDQHCKPTKKDLYGDD
jgi:hypothetical protein